MNRRHFFVSTTGLLLGTWAFRMADAQFPERSKRYYGIPQDFGVQPQFIFTCKFFTNKIEVGEGRLLPVGLTPLQFDYAINEVYKRMLQPDMDHVGGRSVKDLAGVIQQCLAEVMKRLQIDGKPGLLKQWLLAEAVCGWVSTHVILDEEWERLANTPPSTYADRFRRMLPQTTLGFDRPKAICSGFSRLTRDLAREVGLRCTHLGGENRDCGVPAKGQPTHGWVHFDFGDRIESVGDPTAGRVSLQQVREVGGKMHCGDVILPKSPVEWELFLARFYALQEIGDVNAQGTGVPETNTTAYAVTTMPYADWMKKDTAALGSVWTQYRQAEVEKVKYLNRIRNLQEAGKYP